jgi:hypothetical protein
LAKRRQPSNNLNEDELLIGYDDSEDDAEDFDVNEFKKQ